MRDFQDVIEISIHAPRTGSDASSHKRVLVQINFNPRSPHGERHGRNGRGTGTPHFNPRSPHGERLRREVPLHLLHRISIHAPRTGSDRASSRWRPLASNFNPRSPHGERPGRTAQACALHNFNPRSPHGERPSIRASATPPNTFQSTLPARGATSTLPARGATATNFNPRSPHGERLRKVTILSIRIIGFAQKVYHKTVLLRISLAENAVILPEKPRNPVRTSLQKAGGLRFARAIRAAHPYSISSPSGA